MIAAKKLASVFYTRLSAQEKRHQALLLKTAPIKVPRRAILNTTKLRRSINLSQADFHLLNPHLRRKVIKKQYFTLYVPIKKLQMARAFLRNQIYSRSKIRKYVVRSGDNLSMIARKFNIPVRMLKDFNSLRGNILYPRQVLRVPTT